MWRVGLRLRYSSPFLWVCARSQPRVRRLLPPARGSDLSGTSVNSVNCGMTAVVSGGAGHSQPMPLSAPMVGFRLRLGPEQRGIVPVGRLPPQIGASTGRKTRVGPRMHNRGGILDSRFEPKRVASLPGGGKRTTEARASHPVFGDSVADGSSAICKVARLNIVFNNRTEQKVFQSFAAPVPNASKMLQSPLGASA